MVGVSNDDDDETEGDDDGRRFGALPEDLLGRDEDGDDDRVENDLESLVDNNTSCRLGVVGRASWEEANVEKAPPRGSV